MNSLNFNRAEFGTYAERSQAAVRRTILRVLSRGRHNWSA